MLPPLPYAYQPPLPQGYPSYGPGIPPARTPSLISDPMPTNAFVAKLNMGVEPIVVRDLVNSKRFDLVISFNSDHADGTLHDSFLRP